MAFINGAKEKWFNPIWVLGYVWELIAEVWCEGRRRAKHRYALRPHYCDDMGKEITEMEFQCLNSTPQPK